MINLNKYLAAFFLITFWASLNAQIPPGYYDSTVGKTGYILKTALKTIITNGHIDRGYGNLYSAYTTSDKDNFYDNDNSVLDMYSENPTGADPYFYTHNVRKCGSYSAEDDCYNREHLMPQSVFSSASPMKNDVHFVVPSDGYVNGQRGNFPFGEVTSSTWTSLNGSKKGPCTFPGYSNIVFEPIDEFKGDIARCMLYFATRYETQVSSWSWYTALNGTSTQVYSQWFVNLMVKWHLQDTVNQREIVRNNASYTYQGNRNPFIDHPEWVTQIWGLPVFSNVAENKLEHAALYPNPTNSNLVTISNEFPIDNVEVLDVLGKKIGTHITSEFGKKQIQLSNLPKGILFIRIKSGESCATKKLVVQ